MTIEKLTGQVMADDGARIVYQDLAPDIAPADLTSAYQVAATQNDKSTCLAIELHVRNLAIVHFHSPGVIDCLRIVENTPTRWGKRAPQLLQDIAGRIEKHYSAGAYQVEPDGRLLFRIPTGPNSHLKVRCANTAGAAAVVVAKYRRGAPRRNWKARV